ncbi:uncharacterized protein PgNI_12140 [Pyricularia grisea]|uniref:Uncharacterized protein n=1 Tax=Pyricularia grisea TaxID=148305 RepID=A0A6P8AQU3_PYRGI|nr:uncharacterized protein PgNI_12140 [Pyricularia grisea]TLD04411.1 hypothetical protein PgNI_12140 [Pyricularia grisea]
MAEKISTSSDDQPIKPVQILSMGLIRTGSASITQALTTLGYKNVHHGISAIADREKFALFSAAADAHFSTLPTYTGKAFSRADWDALFGDCEAVTDMGSFFAPHLIAAYPDAKVILVERDVDRWFESTDQAIFQTTWDWRSFFVADLLGRMMGLRGHLTIRKVMLGFFEARNVREVRAHAKERYLRHIAEVKAAVAPERLLVFDLKDGWEPLCEFLGKDVPDVPFPVKNERKEHVERVRRKQKAFVGVVLGKFARSAIPWALGVGAFAICYACLDMGKKELVSRAAAGALRISRI